MGQVTATAFHPGDSNCVPAILMEKGFRKDEIDEKQQCTNSGGGWFWRSAAAVLCGG
jgi:hypothetical protein